MDINILWTVRRLIDGLVGLDDILRIVWTIGRPLDGFDRKDKIRIDINILWMIRRLIDG